MVEEDAATGEESVQSVGREYPLIRLTGLSDSEAKGQDDLPLMYRRLAEVEEAAQRFAHNPRFTRGVLEHTAHARKLLTGASANEAIAEMNRAVSLINRAIISEETRDVRWRIFFVSLVWFAALLGMEYGFRSMADSELSLGKFLPDLYQYLWMGMLGGVTASWWGMVRHARSLSFDPSYATWYMLKPAMGAITGGIAVLLIQMLLLAISREGVIDHNHFLLIFAFLAGFAERSSMRLIDRVMAALFGANSKSNDKSTDHVPPRGY
ncbi:MAG: hypothetical protein RRA94_06980 [Bacteroidota bacterium]|nr:hypothetical protein [Bacteroidota bacterium]